MHTSNSDVDELLEMMNLIIARIDFIENVLRLHIESDAAMDKYRAAKKEIEDELFGKKKGPSEEG